MAGNKAPAPRPTLYTKPCPDPRSEVGKSSEKNAPIGLNAPDGKNPRGNPRNNITSSLIGSTMYSRTVVNDSTAKTVSVHLRPILSAKCAAVKYPPNDPAITTIRYPPVCITDRPLAFI